MVNYSPEIPNFPVVNPFLPCYGKFDLTTYIQGASDYEIMANLVQLYNTMADGYNKVEKLSTDTVTAFNQLQDFVNDIFKDPDLNVTLNTILNNMLENGTFLKYLEPALDYVTPEMFGAKGDGITDDSTSIINALTFSKTVHFSNKTYKCNKTIDISDKVIYGEKATLDFADCSDDYAITSTTNGTYIYGLNVINANVKKYALNLQYFANGAVCENLTINNSSKGMRISGSWYANYSNIAISITSNEACLTIDNSLYGNSANALSITNVSLNGGGVGLLIANCTVNSVVFDGIAIENQTDTSVKSINGNGNISFNGLYFENNNNTLIFDTTMFIDINSMLVRGTFKKFAIDNNRIKLNCQPYNPANLNLNPLYYGYPDTETKAYYPRCFSDNNVYNIIVMKDKSADSFSITLNNTHAMKLHLECFGFPDDTRENNLDTIDLFVYSDENGKQIKAQYNKFSERTFIETYTITPSYTTEGLKLTFTNSSELFTNTEMKILVSGFSADDRIVY